MAGQQDGDGVVAQGLADGLEGFGAADGGGDLAIGGVLAAGDGGGGVEHAALEAGEHAFVDGQVEGGEVFVEVGVEDGDGHIDAGMAADEFGVPDLFGDVGFEIVFGEFPVDGDDAVIGDGDPQRTEEGGVGFVVVDGGGQARAEGGAGVGEGGAQERFGRFVCVERVEGVLDVGVEGRFIHRCVPPAGTGRAVS